MILILLLAFMALDYLIFYPQAPPRGDVNPASLVEVPLGGFRGQLILFIFAL